MAVVAEVAAADPLFESSHRVITTGSSPNALAAGDLDADGIADVVTANYWGESVSVLLGDGDGSFDRRTDYEVPGRPLAIALGDLDADGHLDLVVTHYYGESVSVLLGRGDGTFAPRTEIGTGFGPYDVVIADLNGDGRPDLAVANEGPLPAAGTVSVLLGNGDGTFQPNAEVAAGTWPYALAVGDLDRDGRPDLVVSNHWSASVTVLLGNGDGTFRSAPLVNTGNTPEKVELGDLTGDEKLDLVLVNCSTDRVMIFPGRGDGTFSPATNLLAGRVLGGIRIVDLNDDGRLDLAVLQRAVPAVSVLLGRGNGSFEPRREFTVGALPTSLAALDANGDGRLDLAVPGEYDFVSGALSVLLGRGDGTFGAGRRVPLLGEEPVSLVTADLNADARPDFATANTRSGTVSLLISTPDGSWAARVFGAGGAPTALALVDLNHDGRLDAVTVNRWPGSVSVLLDRGDGTLDPPRGVATGSGSVAVAAGDLNGDTHPDLVVTNAGCYECTPPAESSDISVLLGHGDGTFEPSQSVQVGAAPGALAIADLDADGAQDVVVANFVSGTLSVLLGRGDGSFAPRSDMQSSVGKLAIADLDRDGQPDIAIAGSSIAILLGHGDGTFATPLVYSDGSWNSAIAIGDLDADGWPDLAVTRPFTSTCTLFFGRGAGVFEAQRGYGVAGSDPSSVVLADVDLDGRIDLVFANRGTNDVSMLRNLGQPTPAAIEDFQAEVAGGRVRLSWRLSTDARAALTGVGVQRADAEAGPYVRRDATPLVPAPVMAFEDAGMETGRPAWYRLQLVRRDGTEQFSTPVVAVAKAPHRTLLAAPSESPRGVVIRFDVADPGGFVRLSIHDARGREVQTFVSRFVPAGTYHETWDRRDRSGARVARGVYFVRLRAGTATANRKFLVLRP